METTQRSIASAIAIVALFLTFPLAPHFVAADDYGLGLQGSENDALAVLRRNVKKGDLPARWRWDNRNYLAHGRSGDTWQAATFRVRSTPVEGDPRGASTPWVFVKMDIFRDAPSTNHFYDELISNPPRRRDIAPQPDILSKNLDLGERSVHWAEKMNTTARGYNYQWIRVYWENRVLEFSINDYGVSPQVVSDQEANNMLRALATAVVGRILGEPRDEFKVSVSWKPENPMIVEVSVNEKVGGQWYTPAAPVWISLVLYRGTVSAGRRERQLIDAYHRQAYLGNNAPQHLLFSAPPKVGAYQIRPELEAVGISLLGGTALGSRMVGPLGHGDRHWRGTHNIEFAKLHALWLKMNAGAPSGASDHGRLIAEIEAVAYRFNQDGSVKILATSKRVPIWLDHVAEIIATERYKSGSLGVAAVRPSSGLIKEFGESNQSEMGRELSPEECVKLIPGDEVHLGWRDGVTLRYLLTLDEWDVVANRNALRDSNPKVTGFSIGPVGGADAWPRAESVGVFVLKGGVSMGLSHASRLAGMTNPGWGAVRYVVGSVIGAVIGGADPGPDVQWFNVTLEGTRVGIDVLATGVEIFRVEGRASLSDSSGKEVALTEGQMLKLGTAGNLSDPVGFRTEDLSASLKSALDKAVRRSGSDELPKALQDRSGNRVTPPHPDTTASLPIRAAEVRFFESGKDNSQVKGRVYRHQHYRSKTRYISYALQLEYPEQSQRLDFEINSVWYRPDGTEICRQSAPANLPVGKTRSLHWDGHGRKQPGWWEPGVYRVDISAAGQPLATASFEIIEPIGIHAGAPWPAPGFSEASASRLRFFSSGRGFPPMSERSYAFSFTADDTCFVNWELHLAYVDPGRRLDFAVDEVWYRPDGSVFYRGTVQTHVEAGWTRSNLCAGRGSAKPGSLAPGRYRVELRGAGEHIATGWFEIVTD